jgi:lactate dehydrogenase-like 2-hydroxyacid dehydrogenase
MQVGPVSLGLQKALEERYDVLRLWKADDRQAALADAAGRVQAVVTSARNGCKADVIAALPGLKAVCSQGVGYDTIDLQALRARGIPVSNTPDVLTDCVADQAWGLLIAASRRLAHGDRYVRQGLWLNPPPGGWVPSLRVSGKRLGVLGLGRIGRAIAQRGQGFGMQVRYHNRTRRDDTPGWEYEDSVLALAQWADFLVVATVGGAQTSKLISAQVLEALGPSGVLVNIARGSVVDEAALVAALQRGRLGGAGLDVFEHEPRVPEALFALDNVVLSPHVAAGTVETRQATERLVLENLESALATGRVLTPIPHD